MADRTKRGQTLHDKTVAKWVNQLRGSGKQVLADLPDHKKPPAVRGYVPDVVVKQGGRIKLIGEVETRSTLKSDLDQQQAFRKVADKFGADFKIKVAKEKRR